MRKWTTSRVAQYGSPGNSTAIAVEFVRKSPKGLWYRTWADAHGCPEKGKGVLFNPVTYVIGQNVCRQALEALGLKDALTAQG